MKILHTPIFPDLGMGMQWMTIDIYSEPSKDLIREISDKDDSEEQIAYYDKLNNCISIYKQATVPFR